MQAGIQTDLVMQKFKLKKQELFRSVVSKCVVFKLLTSKKYWRYIKIKFSFFLFCLSQSQTLG